MAHKVFVSLFDSPEQAGSSVFHIAIVHVFAFLQFRLYYRNLSAYGCDQDGFLPWREFVKHSDFEGRVKRKETPNKRVRMWTHPAWV
jgi:hypothetical protein